jgi:carboxypeptidase T
MRPFVLLAALLAAAPLLAQTEPPRYSEVRLHLAERADLHALGLEIDHARTEKTAAGVAIVAVLSAGEVGRLAASGLAYDVLVDDVTAEVAARAPMTEAERHASLAAGRVAGFDYGSMAGYHTFAEVVERLDEMASLYPELVTPKFSIGQSWNGEEIWAVKISDNPDLDEPEPQVLYTALHHAREPQSMATVLYFMYYLLEHYGTDPEVTYLVNERELLFIPVLNPDGYLFNEQTAPGGGGLWRKNRRDNGGNVYGVDLNRNYGYLWGYDNNGSSPNPSSDVYRGPGPFSEPETAALRDFLLGREVRTALNYHSHGDLWIYPWGYEPSFYTPDSARFVASAREMTRLNGYTYGTADQTVGYLTNGSSDDWMYGEQSAKPMIMSYTPEVGPSFWPPQSQIVPLADENVEANLVHAWLAGAYPSVEGFEVAEAHAAPNGHLDPGEPAVLTASLWNIGQEPLAEARARVISTDPALEVEPGAWSAPFALGVDERLEVGGLAFTLGSATPLGLRDGLAVEVAFGEASRVLALGPIAIGTPVAVFEDDAGSAGGWDTGLSWGLSPLHTSPPTSFADTPSGNYANNTINALTLAAPLDLSEGESPVLHFNARWDVEPRYDFVQVRASTNGAAWTPLAGRHTRRGSGSGVQPPGQPGYDGRQLGWVEEVVDLSAFEGAPEVYLQFRLRSDGAVTADGFFVDDLAVQTFINGNSVSSEGEATPADAPEIREVYPNPFAGATAVVFTLSESGPATLAVYDVLGRRVRVLAEGPRAEGRHEVRWDGRGEGGTRVASGLYVLELRAGGASVTRKLVVLDR